MIQAEVRAAEHVEQTARDIQQDAMERSRVDTGFMRGNWQAVPVDKDTWEVYNDTEYVIYNEYGTAFMAAQPMLHPAVDAAEVDFIKGFSEVYVVP